MGIPPLWEHLLQACARASLSNLYYTPSTSLQPQIWICGGSTASPQSRLWIHKTSTTANISPARAAYIWFKTCKYIAMQCHIAIPPSKPSTLEVQHYLRSTDNRKLLMLWESHLYGNTSLRHMNMLINHICQTFTTLPLHLHKRDCGSTTSPQTRLWIHKTYTTTYTSPVQAPYALYNMRLSSNTRSYSHQI